MGGGYEDVGEGERVRQKGSRSWSHRKRGRTGGVGHRRRGKMLQAGRGAGQTARQDEGQRREQEG